MLPLEVVKFVDQEGQELSPTTPVEEDRGDDGTDKSCRDDDGNGVNDAGQSFEGGDIGW